MNYTVQLGGIAHFYNNLQKEKKLSKKSFFIFKVLITIISFVAILISKSTIDWSNIWNNTIDSLLLKESIYDISVGIFSAMVLVWFIDEINERIKIKQTKQAENETILRFDKINQKYIDRYKALFYCTVTPISDRTKPADLMPSQILLKDMKDLYKTTLLIIQDSSESSVSSFFQIEEALRQQFIRQIEKNDFVYNTKIYNLLSKYIEISIGYDCRSAIMKIPQKTIGNEPAITAIEKMLEKNADEYFGDLQKGKSNHSNLMYPYIILRQMMLEERDVILQYEEEINKIKKNQSAKN